MPTLEQIQQRMKTLQEQAEALIAKRAFGSARRHLNTDGEAPARTLSAMSVTTARSVGGDVGHR
jgi:hypothetical protein